VHKATSESRLFSDQLWGHICFIPPVVPYIWQSTVSFFSFWRWVGSSTQAWMRILQMIWVWRATVEWYWQGKTEELGEKPVPVPLCPPQIRHRLTRASGRTRASAVRGRQLTTWAMARPSTVSYITESHHSRLVSQKKSWPERRNFNSAFAIFPCVFLVDHNPTRTGELNSHRPQSPMLVEGIRKYDVVLYGVSKAFVCDTAVTTSVPCSLRHDASHLDFGGPEPCSLS
jgi:hypothetical protein